MHITGYKISVDMIKLTIATAAADYLSTTASKRFREVNQCEAIIIIA